MQQLVRILVDWFPMLLFIGVMIFLVRKMGPRFSQQAEFHKSFIAGIQRQNEVLSRIAEALEKR